MADLRDSDRSTYQVSYTTISADGAEKAETRIFARSWPTDADDGVLVIEALINSLHPDCRVRVNAVDRVLTGCR